MRCIFTRLMNIFTMRMYYYCSTVYYVRKYYTLFSVYRYQCTLCITIFPFDILLTILLNGDDFGDISSVNCWYILALLYSILLYLLYTVRVCTVCTVRTLYEYRIVRVVQTSKFRNPIQSII